jgi:NhaC family Na+:H+ antiporter
MSEARPMSLGYALVPVVALMGLLALNVVVFGDSASYGPNQIAMLVAGFLAAAMGVARGVAWHDIAGSIGRTIGSTSEALLILLLIGALSGTWLIAGIIPAFIDYGLRALNAEVFLAAACIICAALSLATGTSWGTVGTVGVALAGIGTALGLNPGWVAGAIISGAYFGDKLSPMSDTTNLAPAVSGTDLFTHIRYMLYTTMPSLAIALAVFLVAGFGGGAAAEGLGADQWALADTFGAAVRSKFQIHPGLFIAPAAVIFLIVRKMPAAPALLIGVLLGAATAIVFQPHVIRELAGPEATSFALASYRVALTAMTTDVAVATGHPLADELLTAGGMVGMLDTIWLILSAMVLGGILQATGMLDRITRALLVGVNSAFGLIARTVGTCLAFNVLASDQYLAIVVPGNMFREEYARRGLAPENLSRTLEDSGTVTSVLIPWNTCGVAQSGILGISTWTYLPYCIFNWVSPIMSLVVAGLGWKIRKLATTA